MTVKVIPASQIGKKMGVKCLAYAGPGMGKTPVCITAPNPVVVLMEPGSLSIQKTNIPCIEAYDSKAVDEVFAWLKSSNEARKFNTLCFDSGSQMAELYLKKALHSNRDGRKAYGEMAEKVLDNLEFLYSLSGPNVFIICKQDDKPDDGSGMKRPYWPGKDLHIKIPHMFDLIMHMEIVTLADGSQVKGFRTANSDAAVARDRSGALDILEPADLTYIFNKINQR